MASSNKSAAPKNKAAPAPAPVVHPLRRATDVEEQHETPQGDTVQAGNSNSPSPLPSLNTPPAANGNGTAATKEGARVPVIAGEIEGTVLTLTFQDGRKLIIDGDKLTPEIQKAAMMHGLKQKTVDAAAIAKDTTNGRSASLQDKFEAVEEVVNRLTGENATWNKVREGGSGTAPGAGLLVRALMELSGKDRAHTVAFLEGKSKEEVAALRRNEKVALIIARLQAEAAKADAEKAKGAKVDSEALLGSFMAMNGEQAKAAE